MGHSTWLMNLEHCLSYIHHYKALSSTPLSGDTIGGMHNQSTSLIDWRALARTHPSAFLLAAQLLSLFLYAAFDGIAYIAVAVSRLIGLTLVQ